MVSVQYTKLWLTNVVTGEQLGAYTDPARQRTQSVGGDVRSFVGGRQRAIGRAGMSGAWKFRLVELTPDDLTLLRGWLDTAATVFARDHLGQSMYGSFFSLEEGEPKSQTVPAVGWSADVELRRVDVVEGV